MRTLITPEIISTTSRLPSKKIHKNLSITFRVILLTDKQIDKHVISLAKVDLVVQL